MRLTCQSPTPSAPTRWSVSRFGRTRSARPALCPRRNVFSAFVLLWRRLALSGRELLAVDGTRIKAVNNKDRNFTRTSLQEFIRAADERLDDYLRRRAEGDVEEGGTGGGAGAKNLAEKIAALRQKRGRYVSLLAELERTGESQISLTDPDSRAMAA